MVTENVFISHAAIFNNKLPEHLNAIIPPAPIPRYRTFFVLCIFFFVAIYRNSRQRMDIAGGGVVHFETTGGKQNLQGASLAGRLVHPAGGKRRRLRVHTHHRPAVEEIQENARRIGKVNRIA